MSYRFTFLERFGVPAPIVPLYENLSDLSTYAQWGAPAYSSDGRAEATPSRATIFVQGPFPYRLRLDCVITELEAPTRVTFEATGDLEGRHVITLTPEGPNRTVIQSDWRANSPSRALQFLGPALFPAIRWNHRECMTRAYEGLARKVAAAHSGGDRISRTGPTRAHARAGAKT